MLDVKRFGVRRFLVPVLAVFALAGCDAKIDSFFAPLDSDGGGGGGGGGGTTVPGATDVSGTYVVSYEIVNTTCETTLQPFDVTGDFSTSGSGTTITLDVQFPDAAVPISGDYSTETGSYGGETGPVDIGDNFDANEMWSTTFSFSGDDVVFSGTSDVDVTQDGSPVCMRMFDISGIRSGP